MISIANSQQDVDAIKAEIEWLLDEHQQQHHNNKHSCGIFQEKVTRNGDAGVSRKVIV